MGKIARVSARRLAYDQMKAERKQYILIANNNNNNVNKKQLSENDINHFMKNIDKNNTSYFGLVKLRQINLDTLFMYESVEITLLQYACMKGRDSIVMNLLRANANPIIRNRKEIFHSKKQQQVKNHHDDILISSFIRKIGYFLSSLNLRYTTYLMNQIVSMRDAGNKYFSNNDNNNNNKICHFCKDVINKNEACIYNNCNNNDDESLTQEKHIICEYCLWDQLIKSDEMNDEEPFANCPFCITNHDKDNNNNNNNNCDCLMKNLYEFQSLNIHNNDNNDSSSKTKFQLLQQSKDNFYKLPIDKLCIRKKKTIEKTIKYNSSKSKNNKNQRMPKKELRTMLIGETQKKRVEMFYQAIETGNYLRLLHIIYQGIDVNITDENGETGLLMASFHLPKELNVAIYEKNNKAIQDYMTRILENNNQHSDYNTICHYIYCTTILLNCGFANHKIRSHYGISFEDYLITLPSSSLLFSSPTSLYGRNDIEAMLINNGNSIILKNLLSSSSLNNISSNHPGINLAFTIDNAFSNLFLSNLDKLFQSVPQENSDKRDQEKKSYTNTCARRKFFRERSTMWIIKSIEYILFSLKSSIVNKMENKTESINGEKSLQLPSHVLPRMRFLHYSDSGGKMEPHVDLSKNHIYYQQGEINVDFNGKPNLAIESTFTFILHLHDCNDGGETVFLKKLGNKHKHRKKKNTIANATVKEEVEDANSEDDMAIIARVKPKRGRLLIFPHNAPHQGLPVGLDVPKLFLRGELF